MKIYLILILVLITNYSLSARTMHAILAADTLHDITAITKPDINQIHHELSSIAKATKLIYKEQIFTSRKFSRENIVSYIKNLHINPNDVVIFYFSGHGYHTHDKYTPWPLLSFELYKSGLDLKWIADTIRMKNPRFSLVMADCCNNFDEQGYMAETKKICVTLSRQSPVYSGYRHLFLDAKGHIIVCSSSVGQFSYGSQDGGLYTQCFFASLDQESAQQKPSWSQLLKRVSNYMGHIQTPHYQFFP